MTRAGNEVLSIRIVFPVSEKRLIVDTYEALGYRRGIADADVVWIAETVSTQVGIVRIAPEHGTLVLRGMRVAESWRGKGIGTGMLRAAVAWLGARECWCVPYTHVVRFYAPAGFMEVAEENAPAFLSQRLAEYRATGLSVSIMRRGDHATVSNRATTGK